MAYLGPQATFTHQACMKRFSKSKSIIPKVTIADVFNAVNNAEVDYGVVPVENSTEGAVTITFDLFHKLDVSICSEIYLKIHHNLLSNSPLENIDRVYSHRQALAQCRGWLSKNLPNAELVETASTSQAAEKAAKQENRAAIASILASKQHDIGVLAKNIEDQKDNITRFLVIGKHATEASGHDKTSISFALKDEAGALYNALLPFKENQVNMSMIQSRPCPKKNWEYIFFIDLIGHVSDQNVKESLEKLDKHCDHFKVLGSYPLADKAVD